MMHRSTKVNDGACEIRTHDLCLSDQFEKRARLAQGLLAALRSHCLTQNDKRLNGGKQAIKAMACTMTIG
jgi:hypothetical protein